MSNSLIVQSIQKGIKVFHSFGPIHIRPHEAVLRSVKARSQKGTKKAFRIYTEPRSSYDIFIAI